MFEEHFHEIKLTLLVFFLKFTVWFCESRLGAPRFKELRPGSVGRYQVSFCIICLLFGPFGIIGSSVVNQTTTGIRDRATG